MILTQIPIYTTYNYYALRQ